MAVLDRLLDSIGAYTGKFIFLRSLLYSFGVSLTLYLINLTADTNYPYKNFLIFFLFAFLLLENLFSFLLIKKRSGKKINFWKVFDDFLLYYSYIFLSSLSLGFLFLVSRNYILNVSVNGVLFLVLLFYMYYLHIYISGKHIPNKGATDLLLIENRFDFLKLALKFYCYFSLNLTILYYFANENIGLRAMVLLNFISNLLVFSLHLVKKNLASPLNLLVSLTFSLILSTFVYFTPYVNLNMYLGTLITYFYLSFSIYYHFINRNLTKRIFLEYLVISIIISWFLIFI